MLCLYLILQVSRFKDKHTAVCTIFGLFCLIFSTQPGISITPSASPSFVRISIAKYVPVLQSPALYPKQKHQLILLMQ